MRCAVAHTGLPMRLGKVLVGFAVAFMLLFSLMGAAVSPAYADEVDPQTQEALQQLEQAFADAYEESQNQGAAADEASSLQDDASAGAEAIDDEETPLAAQPGASGAEADEAAAVEEEIADDENPLAANPYAAPVHDFVWVLLVAIIAVAGFFFLSNRRLDKNIDQMRRFVD